MYLVSLCVLRLTNFGFVQSLHLGSLWNFARVCFLCFACFALQTPGLCSAFPSAPFEFVRLCLSCFVMRTLPHKHRVCAVLFSRFTFKRFVVLCLSHFLFLLCLTNIGLVSAFSLGSSFLNVCTLMFAMFCYAYFASQTSGLCSAFPLAPCYVCTLIFVMLCYAYFAPQTSVLCSAFLSAPF